MVNILQNRKQTAEYLRVIFQIVYVSDTKNNLKRIEDFLKLQYDQVLFQSITRKKNSSVELTRTLN